MASLFTRIVRGEIPCHRVADNEQFLAFLDIAPLRGGPTLVIPKVEVDKFFELPADVLAGIMPFAQGVAVKIAKVFPCDRVGMCVIGLEVPHAHVHLIPLDRLSDMDFAQPKLKLTSDELAAIAALIRNA